MPADAARGKGRLTTHVLDTMHGRPAAGVRVELGRLGGGTPEPIREGRTNADGRLDAPLLDESEMTPSLYEIRFFVGSYFRELGVDLPDPPFLDVVPIRFGIAEPQAHYHVPLLISPYGYSTYRGS